MSSPGRKPETGASSASPALLHQPQRGGRRERLGIARGPERGAGRQPVSGTRVRDPGRVPGARAVRADAIDHDAGHLRAVPQKLIQNGTYHGVADRR